MHRAEVRGPPEEGGLQNGSFCLLLSILQGITAQNKQNLSYRHPPLCVSALQAEAPAEETLACICLSQGNGSQRRSMTDSTNGSLGQFLAYSPVRTSSGPQFVLCKEGQASGGRRSTSVVHGHSAHTHWATWSQMRFWTLR